MCKQLSRSILFLLSSCLGHFCLCLAEAEREKYHLSLWFISDAERPKFLPYHLSNQVNWPVSAAFPPSMSHTQQSVNQHGNASWLTLTRVRFYVHLNLNPNFSCGQGLVRTLGRQELQIVWTQGKATWNKFSKGTRGGGEGAMAPLVL